MRRTLNIAEFAPMPSAIVSNATQVNPGFRVNGAGAQVTCQSVEGSQELSMGQNLSFERRPL